MDVAELPQFVFSFIICFARIGTAIMLLPGFGESYVPVRFRLMFALMLSYMIFPIVQSELPAVPQESMLFFVHILREVAIGSFLGMIAKMIFASLMAAGVIISFHASLSNALMFDPTNTSQSGAVGAFLTTTGMVILFATNMHYLILMALVESYGLFQNFSAAFVGDMSETIIKTLSSSFYLATKMAAPFIVMSLILNSVMGLLAKLMPQMQVYFVLLPIQLAFGFMILGLVLPMIMTGFLQLLQDTYGGIFNG